MASTVTATGTITASGQSVEIDCTGYASCVISILGTFTGTLRARGSADTAVNAANATLGGRLLFKSGVGGLGVTSISGTGAAVASEFRAVCGGRRFIIDAPAWTSGSAVITITATDGASLVFINGPVHTALEEAIRAGRTYNASTGLQAVAANNFLNTRITNPTGSGKVMHLYKRRIDNNIVGGNAPLEYFGISNPTVMPGTLNTIANSNMRAGGPASAMVAQWSMATTRLDQSPTVANPIGGMIATNGLNTVIDTFRVLEPGQSFGHYIGGAGGGLAATARVGFAWFWWEEDAA